MKETQQLPYDQTTRDLAAKAASDVTSAIMRTWALADTADQKLVIALQAAGGAFATVAGCIKGKYECSDEDAYKVAFDLCSPQVLAEVIAKKQSQQGA